MKYFLITSFLLSSIIGWGQTVSVLQQKSKVTVFGTSTLHDWEMVAETMSGTANLTKDEKQVKSLSSLTFNVTAESLKSGKSGMDKNAYNALKTGEHKTISYQLSNVESIKPSIDGKGYIIRSNGKLSVAGKTNEESFKVYSLVLPDGTVQFKGEVSFPMSKYGIEPPTAVMGTIKTGDDIKIKFSVVYK